MTIKSTTHVELEHHNLTHWGRVTHICVGNLTIIGSDNGLSPGRRQAIIWTKAGLLLIRPLGTNFGAILIEILTFSFKKMRLKVSSAKRRPFCLGLSVLTLAYPLISTESPSYFDNHKWRTVIAVSKLLLLYTWDQEILIVEKKQKLQIRVS